MAFDLLLHRNVVTINEIDKPTPRAAKNAKKSARSDCKGFSMKSKLRLHRLLEKIQRPEVPIFVTLTYHDFPEDWQVCKKHLHTFSKRLRRLDPQISAIWRLEYQERGAPHYHVVCWASSPDAEAALLDNERMLRVWCESSGQTSRAARKYACLTEPAQNASSVYRYLCGHHLKEDQVRQDLHSGRYWGIIGREFLDGLDPVIVERLEDRQMIVFRRLLCSYLRHTVKRIRRDTLRKVRAGNLSELFIPLHDQLRLIRCARAIAPIDCPF